MSYITEQEPQGTESDRECWDRYEGPMTGGIL